jgi:Mn2+/Fe2+ NRAMP family transporter
MGPGLVVMAADNDAGSLATFAQAGQDYGLRLAWMLVLAAVMLYLVQEMVARLGAVTGAGHARLITERFGPRWGSLALADLLSLGGLTVMTEFIGLQLGLGYFGVSRYVVIPVGAALLLVVVAGGSIRWWERSMFVLVAASLVSVPLAVVAAAHRPLSRVVVAQRIGVTGTGVLFAVGVIGAALAPWQLFFQQSNVVDKRITARWLAYERADTATGAVLFFLSSAAVLVACALAFHASPLHGRFTDAGGVARALRGQVGSWAGSLFAVALVDASLLGASAVALASAYAVGDVRGTRHSLHRRWATARSFYATYTATVVGAAAAVLLIDGSFGVITLIVQALSGALFPSAAVFLLFLANDRELLGPHVNRRWLNLTAGALVVGLLILSGVLDLTTAFPRLGPHAITVFVVVCAVGGILALAVLTRPDPSRPAPVDTAGDASTWSMPPIESLAAPVLSQRRRLCLAALRVYLVVTVVALVIRAVRVL